MKSFSLLFVPEILFPIDLNFPNTFKLTQVTQLIEVVKQKIFQTWEYYPRTGLTCKEDFIYPLLKCFISPLFTVSQSPQF